MPDDPSVSKTRTKELLAKAALAKPALENLNPSELAHVVGSALFDGLKDDARQQLWARRIDRDKEAQDFLDQAGRVGSIETRRTYEGCLHTFAAWCIQKDLDPLLLSPSLADAFAKDLTTKGKAPATVRKIISGVSAFYSFLERRFDEIKNPFRGTQARPKDTAAKPAVIPSTQEVEVILCGALPPLETAAAAVLALRGLRVGALPSLTIRGGKFQARSKGRDVAGIMPPEVLAYVEAAALVPSRPFGGWTGARLSMRLYWAFKGLFVAGKLAAQYSAHDLRHYFAVTEYRKNRDLYQLQDLLAHSSPATTERYLRGLGELVE